MWGGEDSCGSFADSTTEQSLDEDQFLKSRALASEGLEVLCCKYCPYLLQFENNDEFYT